MDEITQRNRYAVRGRLEVKSHFNARKSGRQKLNSYRGNKARGLNFVVCRQPMMRSGLLRCWHRLFLIGKSEDGTVVAHPMEIIDRYFDDHPKMSKQHRKETCQVFGLLIDHTVAILPSLTAAQLNGEALPLENVLFRSFAVALAYGTVSFRDDGVPVEEKGLYWRPRSARRAFRLLSVLDTFFDHLGAMGVTPEWLVAYKGTTSSSEAFRVSAHLAIRRSKSLLAHLQGYMDSEDRKPPHPYTGVVLSPDRSTSKTYSFPAKWVPAFLLEGFTNERGETDETAQLIAFFLFYGGVRTSEPFHLFCSDVQFVAQTPVVYLHHPEEGLLQYGADLITRKDYLQHFQRTSRTMSDGRDEAGWKSVRNDDEGDPIYWLPVDGLMGILGKLLKWYLHDIRPALMMRRPARLGDHPFLFVSSGRTGTVNGGDVGDLYTPSAFRSAWKAAVRRIARRYPESGLKYGKRFGTSPHGARHFYGRFLRTIGISGEVIRVCMHHKHPDSHLRYVELSPDEVNAILTKAAADDNEPSTPILNPLATARHDFMANFHGDTYNIRSSSGGSSRSRRGWRSHAHKFSNKSDA
ncbi:site-specific integrase [Agrobacterium larrymoorei]|uniref:Site-specific integrase n=1 Tax=Agrobacterium larrymoorei TaxID=160699 RepID=A0AAF0KF91_9HYPH|nr:site-specific integrase [Agrobacterium larrymoorei]WHA43255.1 site-specific integrase [Agrobacterium larrymoorei]